MNCMSRDFSFCRRWEKLEGSMYEITTEQYWAWRRFRIYTHAAWPLRMCISVYFCLSCVTVHIYIVPLTIICMHNLKGKIFVWYIYHCIVILSKVLSYFFFYFKVFLLLDFVWFDCPACTVFERPPSIKLYPFWGGNVQS